jgi:hypothetical protein
MHMQNQDLCNTKSVFMTLVVGSLASYKRCMKNHGYVINDNVKQLGFRRKENPELLEEDEGEDCVGPQTNKCWDEPLEET